MSLLIKYNLTRENRVIIDIGTHDIKLTEVHLSKRKVKVLKTAKIEGITKFTEGKELSNLPELVKLIVENLKENNISSKKIALKFPCKSMQTKLLKLPTLTSKEMKEYVSNEYISSFGKSCNLTHSLDYCSLGDVVAENEMYSTALIAALPRITINSIIKEFKKHKYDIVDVDTDITSMFYMSILYKSEYEKITKLLIDIGSTTTNLLTSHRGATPFIREAPYGGYNIIRDIQKELDIPASAVTSLVQKLGVNPEDNVNNEMIADSLDVDIEDYIEAMNKATDNLINDIYKSIKYLNVTLKMPPDNIILSGGVSHIKGLREKFENALEINSEQWELVSSMVGENIEIINSSNKTIDGSFMQSIGMALKEVLEV